MAIMATFSNLEPYKIYPNWDFWFEKNPSGNPGAELSASSGYNE
jgi:hypothetical protein